MSKGVDYSDIFMVNASMRTQFKSIEIKHKKFEAN